MHEPPSSTAGADRVPSGLRYVPALDGIRAIAVAAVLLYHGGVTWMPGGFLGVDLFFVLSGYLITSLLLREREATGGVDLARFWLRRARRLLPAAFLVIAGSLAVLAVAFPEEAAQTRADALASLAYVNNWHQIVADQSYFATFERPSLLQHLWSLAVEEQFYLLWPLALGLCLTRLGRRGAMLVTLGGALASALLMGVLFDPGQDPSRVYFGTDTHASGLLVGALLAFAWPLGPLRSTPQRGAVTLLDAGALAGLVVVGWAMTTWQDYDPWVYRGGLLTFAVAAAVVIGATAHEASRVGRWLGVQPLRWIGQRSYGIYLYHWPVMALTRPELDLDWNRTLLLGLQLAVTVAIAAASYRWVEQPIRTGTAQRAIRAALDRRPPRGRLAIALAATLAVVVPASWVATRDAPARQDAATLASTKSAAAAARPASEPATAKKPRGRPLAVGASVMLAAQTSLGRHATVDAAVGRQTSDIIGRLAYYRSAGQLPSRVIVQLGENGPVWGADVRALRAALRGVDDVVLVNVRVPRRWNDEVNSILAETVEHWPEARLADWHAASAAGGLLYDDGTHPNPEGQEAYAKLIVRALREDAAAAPPDAS